MRQAKVLEFINLRQRDMSVRVVANPREKMSNFVSGPFVLVVKELSTPMVVQEMNVYQLIIHAQ